MLVLRDSKRNMNTRLIMATYVLDVSTLMLGFKPGLMIITSSTITVRHDNNR